MVYYAATLKEAGATIELHKIVYKKMNEMMNGLAKAAQNSGLRGKIKTDETFLIRGAKRAPASCGMDGKGVLPLKKYAKKENDP